MENKIVTMVNLERHGIAVESLCGVEEEICRHLFFECITAWCVWYQCFAWLSVMSVCNAFSINDIWKAIWIAVVNGIWKYKNNVIFKGEVIDGLKLFAMIQLKVWSWITFKSHYVFFSLTLSGAFIFCFV